MPDQSQQLPQQQLQQQPQSQPQQGQLAVSAPMSVPASSPTASKGGVTPAPGNDSLAVDPDLEDPDEQVAKRPRLAESQDPSLEDEAVMSALAAHNNPAPVDHYGAE